MKTGNKRIDIKSLLFGAALGASIVLSVAAATTPGKSSWEYKVVQGAVFGNEGKLEDAINSQAVQGWNFVSASSSVEKYGFAVMRREK